MAYAELRFHGGQITKTMRTDTLRILGFEYLPNADLKFTAGPINYDWMLNERN